MEVINEARSEISSLAYLRTGLETASGVATPIAFMRCCIVGVADDDVKLLVPMRGTAACCICWMVKVWSGDNASGVYVLWIIVNRFNARALRANPTAIFTCVLGAD